MIQIFATLQVLGAHAMHYLDDQATVIRRARDERGSITIEQVLWAAAIIAIAVGVLGVIRAFVNKEADKIR